MQLLQACHCNSMHVELIAEPARDCVFKLTCALQASAPKASQDATLSPSRLSSSRGAAAWRSPTGSKAARSPLGPGRRGRGRSSSSKQHGSFERQEQAGTSGSQRPSDGQDQVPERLSAHRGSQEGARLGLASPKGRGRRGIGFSPRGKSASAKRLVQLQGGSDRQGLPLHGSPAERVPKRARRRLGNRNRSRDRPASAQAHPFCSLALLAPTELMGCSTASQPCIQAQHASTACQHNMPAQHHSTVPLHSTASLHSTQHSVK